MRLIKNFDELATTPEREVVLQIIEAGLSAIQPENVIHKNISLQDTILTIQDKTFDLSHYEHIYLIGFGKGSAGISKLIEEILGERLSEGYVIDTNEEKFSKIKFTKGTHPLPSLENFKFTKKVIERFNGKLTKDDLVLVVICGGGSAMLVAPNKISLDQKIAVNKALLTSGATIIEMNTVRKHLSRVKGGGLAKILYPSTVVSLIFSDVPGNDLSFIASGPTVKDATSIDDAWRLIKRFKIEKKVSLAKNDMIETPKEDKYFEKAKNLLILSNQTALSAMFEKALLLGWKVSILSDRIEGEAKTVGKRLIDSTDSGSILLAGGETTVTVHGKGEGGRNQELVLGAMPLLNDDITVASIGSDGWDNTPFAGAIGDAQTLNKAQYLNIDPQMYLNSNNSQEFFEKVKDGITTGRLPSNVSDLMVVLKKKHIIARSVSDEAISYFQRSPRPDFIGTRDDNHKQQ